MRTHFLFLLAISSPPLFAQTTWYVDVNAAGSGPGSGTLQDPYHRVTFAVEQPSTLSGDTLLVAPGTYPLETIDFLGKEINVESTAGAAQTILEGTPSAPVVHFHSDEGPLARLAGFTLQGGGGVAGPMNIKRGGNLHCDFASPTLQDLIVKDSLTVGQGGGLYFKDSAAHLSDSIVENNRSVSLNGSGIYSEESGITLEDVTIRDHDQGGLYTRGGLIMITDCVFRDNTTNGSGCGGHFDGTLVTITGSLFENNVAQGGQGAVRGRNLSMLTMVDTTFLSNGAMPNAGGGAVNWDNGFASFQGCTFIGNAGRYGGALWLISEGNLSNCRFENNMGSHGGAVLAQKTLTVTDCQFVGNRADMTSGSGFNFGGFGAAIRFDLGAADSVVTRCLFLENEADRPTGPSMGGAVSALNFPLLQHCVLANNRISGDSLFAFRGGAASNCELQHCIVWNNDGSGGIVDNLLNCAVNYSLVEGGHAGQNVDGDPRFWDLSSGDVHLLPGSPAIDSGDPSLPRDPDGSVIDMGIYPFDPLYCGPGCSGALGVSYCSANPNSTGQPSILQAVGNPLISENLAILSVSQLPPGAMGFFVAGSDQGWVPLFGGSQGNLCLAGQLVRLNGVMNLATNEGAVARQLDLPELPPRAAITAGSTWRFQFWHRDSNPSPTSNTSQAIEIAWQ